MLLSGQDRYYLHFRDSEIETQRGQGDLATVITQLVSGGRTSSPASSVRDARLQGADHVAGTGLRTCFSSPFPRACDVGL